MLLDDLLDEDFDEDIRKSEQVNTKQASSVCSIKSIVEASFIVDNII